MTYEIDWDMIWRYESKYLGSQDILAHIAKDDRTLVEERVNEAVDNIISTIRERIGKSAIGETS